MERNQKQGNLYLVPTPIGNLKDLSERFFEVINNVEYIACEDTRNTQKLLNFFSITKKYISCHEHNEKEASEKIYSLIENGTNVAYMSDAGYPCISDPGYLLVQYLIEKNVNIIPICGPNASLNALIGSGISTDHYMFYGFLSSKPSERKSELEKLKDFEYTIIFYESPHRIDKTINDIYEVFGERNICIARELTKIHEEFIRSTTSSLAKSTPLNLKGEMVIVIEGNKENKSASEEEILNTLLLLQKENLTAKSCIELTSKILKINKNIVSDIFYKQINR